MKDCELFSGLDEKILVFPLPMDWQEGALANVSACNTRQHKR
jgi:hypothetical protein